MLVPNILLFSIHLGGSTGSVWGDNGRGGQYTEYDIVLIVCFIIADIKIEEKTVIMSMTSEQLRACYYFIV